MMKETFKNVESYIARAPEPAREKLTLMRSLVRAAAPQAEETISYNMPYYNYHGPLVGFAAYKNHVSLFGAFPDELKEGPEPSRPAEGVSSSGSTSLSRRS